MRVLNRYRNIRFLHNFYFKCSNQPDSNFAFNKRQYATIIANNREVFRNLRKITNVTWIHYSDNKKHFINFEKKTDVLKDVLEQRKVQLKDTEYKIRQKGEELIRDIRHQKEITGQKIRDKKNNIVKDILETKEKVKSHIEEVVERENIYTIPNILCVARIAMSPYLGYVILQGNYDFAMGLLVFAGVTDLLDGWIARKWKSQSTKMGSFLDPMADKVLIATLFITLTWQELIPLALTLLIIARDVALVSAGFVIRYRSLPPPRTLSRYFDVTHATAQLAPTLISKINTAVQLTLVGTTLASPVLGFVDHPALQALFGVTAVSTVVSAASYLFSKNTYRILKKNS